MASPQFIGNVVIHGRADCCQDRLTNYEVFVGNDPVITNNAKCPGVHSLGKTVACNLLG
jgi:hypothetical protein